MCLSTIMKRKPAKEGLGWKVFYSCVDDLYSQVVGGHRPRGAWLSCGKRKSKIGGPHKYPPGFHIFKSYEAAVFWAGIGSIHNKIIKVRYRKAHTLGTQSNYTVVIAKEIFIPTIYGKTR